MSKVISVGGVKVDPGDRVTLPVKFACKQELTLTRLLGNPSTRGTLSPRKQVLRKHQHAEHAAIQTSFNIFDLS